MVATAYDVAKIRKDFPILHQFVNGKPLCYLDNAASTQRPSIVIETLTDYYRNHHSNVHRGVHTLSQRATDLFDASRRRIQAFLGAEHESEIIFTKGSTEAINLVAHSWGLSNLKPGDQILLTQMEHHANIVPWQVVAEATGAEIIVAPIDDSGVLILEEYEKLLTERVKLCGVVHVSNSLGTVNPIKWITDKAHKVGAKVLVDGAQACAHVELNMKELGVDFYTLASHKIYGPTGLGALYGRRELLEAMPPYQTGGGMIRSVTFEKTTYAALPEKFEPGTPNIADAIGLKVALDYLDAIGIKNAADHEHKLTRRAMAQLREIEGVNLHGTAPDKAGIVSFTMDCAHPHDIGQILDSEGVAIRAGHHCCQPLMKRLGVPATARASFALYNTEAEVDALVRGIQTVKEVFA